MKSIGYSTFVVLLACLDAVALARLLTGGTEGIETAFGLHLLAAGGAGIVCATQAEVPLPASRRWGLGVLGCTIAWTLPVAGVILVIFCEPGPAARARKEERGSGDSTGWRIGNPSPVTAQSHRLTEKTLAGIASLPDYLYHAGPTPGIEAVRAALTFRGPNSLLAMRRFAAMRRGRSGLLAEEGLRAELERTRRRVRWYARCAEAAPRERVSEMSGSTGGGEKREECEEGEEGIGGATWHILAAEGYRSLWLRGLHTQGAGTPLVERMGEHLEAVSSDPSTDSLLVLRQLDALLLRHEFDRAYAWVMDHSTLDDLPLRLCLARIRAAQGLWSGLGNLAEEMSEGEWAPVSGESRHFWTRGEKPAS